MENYILHRLLLIAAVLITLFTMLLPSYSSLAQEPSPILPVNPGIVAYAEAFSISIEEAERRLNLQGEMSDLQTKIIEREPLYAGSWTQHEPEFGLVVAFKSPDGQAIIQKYLEGIEWADLVIVQEAPFTDDELFEIYGIVKEAANKTGIPFESGPNYRTSTLDFFTPQPEELRVKLEAAETLQPHLKHINIIYQEALSVPAQVSDSPAPFWLEWLISIFRGYAWNPLAPGMEPLQPSSPLIPGKNTSLLENRWRLTQVVWQERQIDWEQIGPVFISFDMQGLMGIWAVNCNAASFIIVAEDERHYQLVPAESTAIGCGELGDQQERNLHDAIGATTEYELQGNQLILSGKDVSVLAEIEPPSP